MKGGLSPSALQSSSYSHILVVADTIPLGVGGLRGLLSLSSTPPIRPAPCASATGQTTALFSRRGRARQSTSHKSGFPSCERVAGATTPGEFYRPIIAGAISTPPLRLSMSRGSLSPW
jgi:hypothetical protein